MDYTHHYQSPIGNITLASDGHSLVGLWFDSQKYFADILSQDAEEKELEIFNEADEWLDLYFAGKIPNFTPQISMRGSEFRKTVWGILLSIPYGETMTYGEIAKRIAILKGVPTMSAQAVGGAVGHNSISLIIPCHRVVGTNGSLTGYAGGIKKKKYLLSLEGVDMAQYFTPQKGTAL